MADPVQGKDGKGAIGDFASGFFGNARGTDASAAKVVGDIAGSLVIGEVKGVKDIFEGLRSHDSGLLIGGLIQLIPVAGGAAKSIPNASRKLAARVGKNGVQKTALLYGRATERAARQALKNPANRKKLADAASNAGQYALSRLVARLEEMGESGETPDVQALDHRGFIDARESAEEGMGAKPSKLWFDLEDDASDKKAVVGRHELDADHDSVRGFRLMSPELDDGTARIYWWNNPDGGEPKFGVESFTSSTEEFDRIMSAYLNRSKSFRVQS